MQARAGAEGMERRGDGGHGKGGYQLYDPIVARASLVPTRLPTPFRLRILKVQHGRNSCSEGVLCASNSSSGC